MKSNYLSKSDFKAAFDCGTKIFYRKNRYPSTVDDDEFLRCLAEGGFMVEEIAHAAFPGAMGVKRGQTQNLKIHALFTRLLT